MRGGYGQDGHTIRGDRHILHQSSLDDRMAPVHCPDLGGEKPHNHSPCRHGDVHADNLELIHRMAGDCEESPYGIPGEPDTPESPGWNGVHPHDPTLTNVRSKVPHPKPGHEHSCSSDQQGPSCTNWEGRTAWRNVMLFVLSSWTRPFLAWRQK